LFSFRRQRKKTIAPTIAKDPKTTGIAIPIFWPVVRLPLFAGALVEVELLAPVGVVPG
jgi:hypothetical protein